MPVVGKLGIKYPAQVAASILFPLQGAHNV